MGGRRRGRRFRREGERCCSGTCWSGGFGGRMGRIGTEMYRARERRGRGDLCRRRRAVRRGRGRSCADGICGFDKRAGGAGGGCMAAR